MIDPGEDTDRVNDADIPLHDRSVRLIQRLTSRGSWQIPQEAFNSIPARLYVYIQTLDPVSESRAYDRAVRLLTRLQEQNLARDRQEIQFLSPQAVGQAPEPDDPAAIEAPQAPQIGYVEQPSLRDAAATAKILDDLGILSDIAQGSAESGPVVDGKAEPYEE